MKSIEEFFAERNSRIAPDAPFTSGSAKPLLTLHPQVRQAANRGFAIFPVPEFARLTGQPELLIGESTSNICRLQEIAFEYPACRWRVALGVSKLCVLRVDGMQGRASLAVLSKHQDDCLTLQARGGDVVWAFFRRPEGLTLRVSAKRLARGVTALAEAATCPVPPSGGCVWLNPRAEIEEIPYWLQELLFESPDDPDGMKLPLPTSFPRTAICRQAARTNRHHRSAWNQNSACNQAGCPNGFRVRRRRSPLKGKLESPLWHQSARAQRSLPWAKRPRRSQQLGSSLQRKE